MKITISRGATINIGNYESARIDISAEAESTDSLTELDTWLKTALQHSVHEIQVAAGLPPHPVERFTG